MILEEKISIFYKYFNHLHSGNELTFETSETEDDYIAKFIANVSCEININSIGFDWLWDYFCFQFSYWSDLTMGYSNSVQISWVLGNKAYARWQDRREDFKFLNEMFAIEKGVSKRKLLELLGEDRKKLIDSLFEIEEVERGRFFNKDKGLIHCIDLTSLATNKSKFCNDCRFLDTCKNILRSTDPDLYRKRDFARRKRIEF